MGKIKVVKFKDFGARCWSTNRAFNTCHQCTVINSCHKKNRFPEARMGKVEIRRMRAKMKYEEAKDALHSRRQLLNEANILEGGGDV